MTTDHSLLEGWTQPLHAQTGLPEWSSPGRTDGRTRQPGHRGHTGTTVLIASTSWGGSARGTANAVRIKPGEVGALVWDSGSF